MRTLFLTTLSWLVTIMVRVVMMVIFAPVPLRGTIIWCRIRHVATSAIDARIPRVIVPAIPIVMTIVRGTAEGAGCKQQNEERFFNDVGHSVFLSITTLLI